MQKALFPGYTVGPDAYEDIVNICSANGKKAAIIVGKKVLDAAESQFQAMESPASGGKHPRQAGGPSRCYRKGSGGHRRPGPAISIDAVVEQEQVG